LLGWSSNWLNWSSNWFNRSSWLYSNNWLLYWGFWCEGLRFGDWLCLSRLNNFSWSWLCSSNWFGNCSRLGNNSWFSSNSSLDRWCRFGCSDLSYFLSGNSCWLNYWCFNLCNWLSDSLYRLWLCWHNSWWLLNLSSDKSIIRRSSILIIKAHLKLRC